MSFLVMVITNHSIPLHILLRITTDLKGKQYVTSCLFSYDDHRISCCKTCLGQSNPTMQIVRAKVVNALSGHVVQNLEMVIVDQEIDHQDNLVELLHQKRW